MRLYPRTKRNGSRVWWASWTEAKRTVRRSTGCTSKSAAEVVVARWERERADPVYAAAQSATFGAEANRFLDGCRGAVERGRMAPGTLSMYEQKAGTLCRVLEASGPLRLADVGPGTFQHFLDIRRAEFLEDRGRPISESELYKQWVTFRQILKGAWRAQRFGRDPASLKPDHFGPEYEPRKTALSVEEIARLLGELGTFRGQPVAFALMTGARRSEVFAAQAEDIDTTTWRVRIRGTKTEDSARTIPIPKLMTSLLVWVPPGPPFAPWPNARRDIIAACKRAKVPEVTWNDLRRTFASRLVQAGVPPHIVAKLLGHRTTAMVDKVYGRQTVESLETLLDAALREPSVNQRPPKRTVRRKAKRKTKRGKT